MTLAILHSRASSGIDALPVSVEAHISNGLPRFSIVGLPETAVKESKDRVRSAILNSHFEFPARRITVNLAPADLPKDGGRFDLPIALGILAASGQIPVAPLNDYEFAGELALSGALRPIHACLPFALATRKMQRQLIIPAENAEEAALPKDVTVYPANHLLEVCAHVTGAKPLLAYLKQTASQSEEPMVDLSLVKGQHQARRALEIAAAGGHHLLLMGPPGTGKTLLANCFSGILPAMSEEEALEVAAVTSISSLTFDFTHWSVRPFRAPHHSASSVALVGGSNPPRPGEISLAHHGVLFLDELPEFNRHVLEALREPLESGCVTVSRAGYQAEFPARFQLIAAMNPCPCGYAGDNTGNCRCTAERIQRYRARISGPLLDRIDMHIEVPRLTNNTFTHHKKIAPESSAQVRERITQVRQYQLQRSGKINAALCGKAFEALCDLQISDQALLDEVVQRWDLSMRAQHRLLKVARTIADLAHSEMIQNEHLSEALSYRCRRQRNP